MRPLLHAMNQKNNSPLGRNGQENILFEECSSRCTRKKQLLIDLMSNSLLEEVVGELLQGQCPKLHPSGGAELTHAVYAGSCCAIVSFLCSDCSFVPFFGRCILCHSSIYCFQLSLGIFKLFFPTLSNNILFPHAIRLPEWCNVCKLIIKMIRRSLLYVKVDVFPNVQNTCIITLYSWQTVS